MATIPTPEQGKPILDFSAGTFDGSSYLFQSRNGATEHVSGDDVADYVNTSRIYNTLDTESKTPVGAINEINAKDASDIPYDNTASGLTATEVQSAIDEVIGNLSGLFLTNTYTAVKSVNANGVAALTGADMGYNSIPTGYTPIDFTFSCTNSNDLFFNMNLLTATGSRQFGVIRNVSSNNQNDKNCTVKITFIKSAFL